MPAQSPSFEDLLNAVIATESSGNPNARGKAGELAYADFAGHGLRYGINDPRMLLDPNTNKAVGSRILTDLLKKYKGNVGLALSAYNAGPGAVDKGKVPESTSQYIDKVMSHWAISQPSFGGCGRNLGKC